MFEVGVVAQFEAAHRLHGEFGPATRTHGHTYRVEVAVRGPELHDDGTLLDITVVQAALGEATAALHYRDLDDLPAFAGRNTTAEAVAKHLFDALAPHLVDRGLATLSVRVWESPLAWAACDGSLDETSTAGSE